LAGLARDLEALEAALDRASPHFHFHAITPSTIPARTSVSSTISITGLSPMSTSDLSEVFMPMAAIAVTRHMRESVDPASIAGAGIQPRLCTTTSAANATANQGST